MSLQAERMALRLLHRPHALLVVLLLAMLAIFPLVETSGAGRCVLNLLTVAAIVFARTDKPGAAG